MVVYDRLVGREILSWIPETAERIDVGKESSHHTVPQERISEILLEKALEVIENVDLLSDGGIIVCESRSEAAPCANREGYQTELERRYGKVKITTIRRKLDK